MRRATILGTGSAFPVRVVTNADFPSELEVSDEWIVPRTGIRERRFAGPGEDATSLATEASRLALEASRLPVEAIDLIVCATITPDFSSPSVACLVQAALGCQHVPAFDLTAACSGFVYALSVADRFVQTGGAKHPLVIGVDLMSRAVDQTDRNICVLFGDGAGAVVLGPTEDPARGVQEVHLYADGTKGGLILVPAHCSRHRPEYAGIDPLKIATKLHGREVFRFAVGKMAELVNQALSECRATGRKIDWVVPHQVNIRIIDAAWESVEGISRDRVIVNLHKTGNTSAASIPLALDEAVRSGKIRPGDTLLLVAFGAGMTWSSAIVTM